MPNLLTFKFFIGKTESFLLNISLFEIYPLMVRHNFSISWNSCKWYFLNQVLENALLRPLRIHMYLFNFYSRLGGQLSSDLLVMARTVWRRSCKCWEMNLNLPWHWLGARLWRTSTVPMCKLKLRGFTQRCETNEYNKNLSFNKTCTIKCNMIRTTGKNAYTCSIPSLSIWQPSILSYSIVCGSHLWPAFSCLLPFLHLINIIGSLVC